MVAGALKSFPFKIQPLRLYTRTGFIEHFKDPPLDGYLFQHLDQHCTGLQVTLNLPHIFVELQVNGQKYAEQQYHQHQTPLDQIQSTESILRVYSWITSIYSSSHFLNCATYFSKTAAVSDVLLSKFEVQCQQWNLSTLLKLRISWPQGIYVIIPWGPVPRGTQLVNS